MSKVKVSCVKASAKTMKAASPGAKAAGSEFLIVDNEDSTCTVQGIDAAGNAVDISNVATIGAVSSDPASLSVDPPSGMTFQMHGLKPSPSPVTISVTATWNDGSIGPFGFDLPCTVSGSAATGIKVTPGTPTVRP